MEGLFGDGLVDEVLFCCGDCFEEDLRWEPGLRVFVDLVELYDVANGGAALFKAVEAWSGTFFSSTGVGLRARGAGGGGTGCGVIDSNTSLPSILTPKHFSSFCYLPGQIGFCLNLFFRKIFGSTAEVKSEIFARRTMVDQAREGLCYQSRNVFNMLNMKKIACSDLSKILYLAKLCYCYPPPRPHWKRLCYFVPYCQGNLRFVHGRAEKCIWHGAHIIGQNRRGK